MLVQWAQHGLGLKMVSNFPNQPSELTVQILERKSNAPIEDISPLVLQVKFTERWRNFGFGSLTIRSEDLSAESTEFILNGNASVRIIREKVDVLTTGDVTNTDTFTGPITKASLMDGNFLAQDLNFSTVANEIIVLGNNTGSSRNVTRVSNTSSQASIGCRELIVDARPTTTSAERTARGNAVLDEVSDFSRQVRAGGVSTGRFTWRLEFADNLVYLKYRHIGTSGVAKIDPGNVAAGNYIRSVLNDNLIIPQSASHDDGANRQIDVPAVIGTYDGIGETLDLPVRWNNLSTVVRTACISGEVGVRPSVNTANQIEYNVNAINDRTSGTTNAVIYNRDNADASFNIQVGDKITLEEYIFESSTTPEIGPIAQLVTAREIIMERGREDFVKLQMGGENRGFTDMMNRNQQSSLQATYA
tara:strand:+ start:887 stop:2140 length:1254 start_codon:yes stop_codon:yes gene_type:complete